jgi:hypothetical protein
MATLLPPSRITITRAEGTAAECVTRCVTSYADADAVLRRWSDTAPATGGYNKCDFKIEWPDGQTYEGRYDLVHWRIALPDLAEHVRGFVNYLAGEAPAWMRAKPDVLRAYQQERARNAAQVAEARTFLTAYDVGQRV